MKVQEGVRSLEERSAARCREPCTSSDGEPPGQVCGKLPPVWLVIGVGLIGVGPQGQELGRRTEHGAEESKDMLHPAGHLCIFLSPCLTITTSRE